MRVNMNDRALPILSALYKVLVNSSLPHDHSARVEAEMYLAIVYRQRGDHAVTWS